MFNEKAPTDIIIWGSRFPFRYLKNYNPDDSIKTFIFGGDKMHAILENAKKYNQIAVSGGYMLIYQAILVLQLWLGKELDISNEEVDILAEKMIEVLNENYS